MRDFTDMAEWIPKLVEYMEKDVDSDLLPTLLGKSENQVFLATTIVHGMAERLVEKERSRKSVLV